MLGPKKKFRKMLSPLFARSSPAYSKIVFFAHQFSMLILTVQSNQYRQTKLIVLVNSSKKEMYRSYLQVSGEIMTVGLNRRFS